MNNHNISNYHNNVILTPWNQSAEEINLKLLDYLQTTSKTYYSKDIAYMPDLNREDDHHQYPPEFLHSLTPSGMPPHELHLKEGATVILLRRLNMGNKLCNGTRMKVIRMTQNALLLEHLQNQHQQSWIPRIQFISDSLPFIFKRRQFPVKLAFCMTIDKSQGNTFERVGVMLHRPVFTHGQLYVAASRTKNFNRLKFEILHDEKGNPLPSDYDFENQSPQTVTENIVYREIFQTIQR